MSRDPLDCELHLQLTDIKLNPGPITVPTRSYCRDWVKSTCSTTVTVVASWRWISLPNSRHINMKTGVPILIPVMHPAMSPQCQWDNPKIKWVNISKSNHLLNLYADDMLLNDPWANTSSQGNKTRAGRFQLSFWFICELWKIRPYILPYSTGSTRTRTPTHTHTPSVTCEGSSVL